MTEDEIRDEAYSEAMDEIAKKDAEIERLQEILESISDHGSAAESMKLIKDQQAEIERLKAIIRRLLKHVEHGTLVRDISKDSEVGWVLPMMRLVVDLKEAMEATK